jgi:prophage regulatory protein
MQTVSNDKILRLKAVLERTGLTRSMAYALAKEGKFPHPVPLGARAVGWLESEVDQWIAERVSARRVA